MGFGEYSQTFFEQGETQTRMPCWRLPVEVSEMAQMPQSSSSLSSSALVIVP